MDKKTRDALMTVVKYIRDGVQDCHIVTCCDVVQEYLDYENDMDEQANCSSEWHQSQQKIADDTIRAAHYATKKERG